MLCENPKISIICEILPEYGAVESECQINCGTHQVCEDCSVICPSTNEVKCFFCEYNCDHCDQ
jgi:hypothetical protein